MYVQQWMVCQFLETSTLKNKYLWLRNILLTTDKIQLQHTFPITVEFLLFIKSQFTTNAQNVLHLNRHTHGPLSHPFKHTSTVVSGLTDIKNIGNKMPTRCNRGFYCRSYCLLNMFRAPLCPSSGAQEYYTVVAACGILCCGFFK